MKKLLILTRFPPEYEPQRLAEEAREKGIEPEIVNYEDVRKIREIGGFDFVIPRSAAHRDKKSLLKEKIALIKSLPEKTICLNKETYLCYPKLGKIKQAEILTEHGLPMIPILKISTSEVSRRRNTTSEVLKRKGKLSFPAILKAEFGSHSRRVVRVGNQRQANEVMKSHSGKWIYQPLIKTPVYWRVIVLGEKSLGIMERKTNKRFLRSGEGEKPKIAKEKIEDLAIKATGVFRAEFAGVDLLTDKNKLMIIEVNRSPQFQIFEKKTKVDVAKEVINYLTLVSR